VIINEKIGAFVRVKLPGKRELFEVIGAGHTLGFAFGLSEGGKQQTGENSNDGDDNEQFY